MKKTAIVTGGTKGIGRAIIHKFASEGFDIITCSRTRQELEHLQADNPTNLDFRVVDMSDKAAVVAFGKYIADHYQRIDVLVNNAGVFVPGEIHTEAEGTLEKMIDTNLYSAYHLTRALVPQLEATSGHIFNMCSTASFVPYVNGGSYCISKFALLGFSKVLREEMKTKGVRVTSIMPGATMSASWEGVDLPEERFMKASDVAEAVYGAYSMSDRTVIEEIVMRPQLGDL